jgi:hypothetical protein
MTSRRLNLVRHAPTGRAGTDEPVYMQVTFACSREAADERVRALIEQAVPRLALISARPSANVLAHARARQSDRVRSPIRCAGALRRRVGLASGATVSSYAYLWLLCLVAWSIERIRGDWLGDGAISLSDEEIVSAFDAVESTFGSHWLEGQRRSGASGAVPTLHIAITGRLIQAVVDMPGSDKILARLGAGEPGASSELLVVATLQRTDPGIAIELEPVVQVGGRKRKPDLGLVASGEQVYVEISSARESMAQGAVVQDLERLADIALAATPFANTSEIYLHRAPKQEEESRLVAIIERLCALGGEQVERGELANVVVNNNIPTVVQPCEHEDGYRPGLSMARVQVEGDLKRHTVVRYPFSDARAAAMLTKEASQLPTGSPGVVILDVSGAAGAMKTWETVLRRRLHPSQHTRVSAVVLIQSGIGPTPEGEAWVHEAVIIENSHASWPCPRLVLEPFRAWVGGMHPSL